VLARACGRDVLAARTERHHQLELVVEVLGRGRVGDFPRQRQRRRVLGEEEGWLPIGVMAHLSGVVGVVAPDAEHAPHREASLHAGDRQDLALARVNDVSHDPLLW
jgi:hypothetical protein